MKRLVSALAGAFLLAAAAPAAACSLATLAEFAVDAHGPYPLIDAKLDGHETKLIVDTGATFSTLGRAAAERSGLKVEALSSNINELEGATGLTEASRARARTFTLGGHDFHDADFFVLEHAGGEGVAGMLGLNVLRTADLELDMSSGVLRLMQPSGCAGANLAYWAQGRTSAFVGFTTPDGDQRHVLVPVLVNGVRLLALMDTGSPVSVLSRPGALRAGLKLDGPDVVAGGTVRGVSGDARRSWLVPVESFSIGGEAIKHTRMRVGEIMHTTADMLLGEDFFRAHRVYIAGEAHKVFFTYGGGPVFDLRTTEADAAPTSGDGRSGASR